MAHFINEDVKVDFEIFEPLRKIVDRLEKMDKEDDWGYFNVADSLDHYTKQFLIDGYITERERNMLVEKYCDYYDKF